MDSNYKRTVAGSIGAGMGAIFNASGKQYYILEHKTETKFHPVGESQKIIIDQIEMGRDSSCQVRFDESCETVSRRHAAIVKDGDKYKLIPLSSTNSTIVNGQPISGEWYLNSGDEIRLSSRGPVIGFIVPQGTQSLVKSIGFTERMNLFRKQALRPYKTALILLTIILVLAIAGLIGWNFYQAKQYEKNLIEKHKQIDNISAQIDEKTLEITTLEKRLKTVGNKSDVQIKNLQEQLETATKKRSELESTQVQLQKDMEDLIKKGKNSNEEAVSGQDDTDTANNNKSFTMDKIENSYGSVYYIRINDIVIYNCETNAEVVRFNMEGHVGGTGFLIKDKNNRGRFVTARRVVQPWYYYDDNVGHDERTGINYDYAKIRSIDLSDKYKVIANFTAYSNLGANFKFSSSDMRGHADFLKEQQFVGVINDKKLVKVLKVDTLHSSERIIDTKRDWMSMAKQDQVATGVNMLECDEDYSLAPVAPQEVLIVGYPSKNGFSHSENINPVRYQNNINVSGLNDIGIIELSSRRYTKGYDGAPVFRNKNGKWVVIGILSHTDTADRDEVVPIADAR